jgi:hypothetical protein
MRRLFAVFLLLSSLVGCEGFSDRNHSAAAVSQQLSSVSPQTQAQSAAAQADKPPVPRAASVVAEKRRPHKRALPADANSAGAQLARRFYGMTSSERLEWADQEFRKRGVDVHDVE